MFVLNTQSQPVTWAGQTSFCDVWLLLYFCKEGYDRALFIRTFEEYCFITIRSFSFKYYLIFLDIQFGNV